MGGGALQRGHGAPLEALEQLGDTLGGVAAEAVNAEAAELVLGQAAKAKRGVSMGVDMKAKTLWAVTHLSEVTALPLSASHSLVMPSAV